MKTRIVSLLILVFVCTTGKAQPPLGLIYFTPCILQNGICAYGYSFDVDVTEFLQGKSHSIHYDIASIQEFHTSMFSDSSIIRLTNEDSLVMTIVVTGMPPGDTRVGGLYFREGSYTLNFKDCVKTNMVEYKMDYGEEINKCIVPRN